MYRLDELIKLNRKLYHSNDLAILWGLANKNTLYTAIKRYVAKGVLIPVYKGLYATIPLAQLDPLELGVAVIHKFAYLSTESVLAQAGTISQTTYGLTFVSSVSRSLTVGNVTFRYRKLKDEYLNNPAGLTHQNGIFVAIPERAAADMLYFNPRYHFDVPDSLDWDRLNAIRKEVGY